MKADDNANGVTVVTSGLYVTGGVSVSPSGLLASSSTLDVKDAGLKVTGGTTVDGAGMTAGGAVSVSDVGMKVTTSGFTVSGTGLKVDFSGARVSLGGFQVTGGLTVSADGMKVNQGGTTVYTVGVYASAGFSVASSGLVVANAFTVPVDLSVTDSMTAAYLGYGTLSNPSDARLKSNITGLTKTLQKISNLKGVYFRWTDDFIADKGLEDRRDVGLLAQDVQKEYPELVVTKKEDGFLSVKYFEMIPVLVEAIKELKEKVHNVQNLANNVTSTLNSSSY
jgi:hypothetical protein